MIPVHPSHYYRRRYYRRVATAMGAAATLHAAAFLLAPAYVPRPLAIAPSPLRLLRLAASSGAAATSGGASASESASPPRAEEPEPARDGAARRLPETISASRVVTEPVTPPAPAGRPGDASIPSAGTAIESEDAAPPVFYRYDTAPRLIRRVDPDYPVEARLRGEEGTVVVNANIDEKGRVQRAWVVGKNASEALVTAVIDAVYQYEFTPGEERGVPVRCTVAIPFTFSLKRLP